MQRIAIFGGTFDPVHWGHLWIAEAALQASSLDRVIWVPSFSPPHKLQQPLTFHHRWAMLQRAIAQQPAFTLSDVELDQQPVPSYAWWTFHDLQTQYPNTHWFWILGLDAFQTLPQWYHSVAIAGQCQWLVAPRASWTLNPAQAEDICQRVVQSFWLRQIQLCWQLLPLPVIDISSSLVRQYCRDRRPISRLVPAAVEHYITDHQLYQGTAVP